MNVYEKCLMVFVMALLSITSAKGQDTTLLLVIERNNADAVSFLVYYDKPIVTFTQNNLVVKSEIGDFEAEISNVKRFYFEETPDKIEDIKKTSIVFNKIGDDKYEVTGVKLNEITVFNSSGKAVSHHHIGDNGVVSIDLGNLPSDVYLIKIDAVQTLKILKK